MGKEGRKRSRRKRQRKGGGRRQVHGSSHQRVVLIESLRGVCSSLLIWLNIPGWLRRRYRRAKIHTERARRADLTYRTNSRARPVPRDYGLPFPWCASWVTIALSLSLPPSLFPHKFLRVSAIYVYTYREGEIPDSRVSPRNRESGSGWGWGDLYKAARAWLRERQGGMRDSRVREVSRAKKDPASFAKPAEFLRANWYRSPIPRREHIDKRFEFVEGGGERRGGLRLVRVWLRRIKCLSCGYSFTIYIN